MSTCSLTILVVEDDGPKLSAVLQMLQVEFPKAHVSVAGSLISAVENITKSAFDLAIVDMSVPTYEFSVDREGGGRPQGFGGEDILRFVEAESPITKTVVLTQYQEFSENQNRGRRSLEDVTQSLRGSLGAGFLGVLYYSGQRGEWRSKLVDLIRQECPKINETNSLGC
jgi:CheY-like chemotaxis protein